MGTPLGLKVDDTTRERLQRVAAAMDRAPHWVLRQALDEYLEREERRLAEAADDAARWERFVITGESVDGAEVNAWLERMAAIGPEP
jgi:predicted transcriptional regulator